MVGTDALDIVVDGVVVDVGFLETGGKVLSGMESEVNAGD